MGNHPIEVLMETAMNSINEMVDVNTIIGEPIETKSGMVIIPISKVCFGFAAGGSEFKGETIDEYKRKEKEEEVQYRLPFGGGSGAGISINPVAFVIVQKDTIKVLPIEHTSAIDKLMDFVPDLMQKANSIVDKAMEKSKDKNKDKKTVDKTTEKEEVIFEDPTVTGEKFANKVTDKIDEKITSKINEKMEDKKDKIKLSKVNKNKKTRNTSDDEDDE